MTSYVLEFPDGFEDYAWELEAKGWFGSAIAIIDGRRYKLSFYDPIRLAQDIEEELKHATMVFETNLIVVPSVNRANMETAVDVLVRNGQYRLLVRQDDSLQ